MPQDTIVVGVDDSARSRAALQWAADLARSTGSTLVGVHVLHAPRRPDSSGYSIVADPLYPDPHELEPVCRTRGEVVFGEVSPEPGWMLRFARGPVGHVLVQESSDARMLVVGGRKRTGLMRWLNGSVGQYCLDHAVCPVVGVTLRAGQLLQSTGSRRGPAEAAA